MFRFIFYRLVQSVLVLFVILTVTFFMVRAAPGGPFTEERKIPEYILQKRNEYYGFDKSWVEQYGRYLARIAPKAFKPHELFRDPYGNFGINFDLERAFGMDFGPTFKETRTVNEIVADTFPVSLELGLWALGIALSLGLPVGILAAVKRNTVYDYGGMGVAMIGICFPTFVMGPILALVFGVWLGWFSVSGWFTAADRVLPMVTLGLVYAAYIARITRGGMLEVLNQDFIRTAQAKGVPFRTIIWKHSLKGGLLPTVSFLGPALAGIISGSFVIETIFQVPGLGRQFVMSAFNRDYFLVQGTVMVYATLIIFANLGVDIVQVILNPRLRFQDK
jgi:oligopeptide transport system permease protein